MTPTQPDSAVQAAPVPDGISTATTPGAACLSGSFAALPDMIRPEELTPVFRCSRSTIYDAIKRGEIPSYVLGRRLYVPKAALLRTLGVTG